MTTITCKINFPKRATENEIDNALINLGMEMRNGKVLYGCIFDPGQLDYTVDIEKIAFGVLEIDKRDKYFFINSEDSPDSEYFATIKIFDTPCGKIVKETDLTEATIYCALKGYLGEDFVLHDISVAWMSIIPKI